jgi:hypothetical protein
MRIQGTTPLLLTSSRIRKKTNMKERNCNHERFHKGSIKMILHAYEIQS